MSYPKYGDYKTGEVAPIQAMLTKAGFYKGDLDDWFLNQTLNAIKAFQQVHRLPITGVLDENTFNLLCEKAYENKPKTYKVTVNGLPFVQWFNQFRLSNRHLFSHVLKENFDVVFGELECLLGKTNINVSEFVAHFCIIYNETGGTFLPISEWGGGQTEDSFVNDAYFFGTNNGRKLSYNQAPSIPAGTLLKNWNIISSNQDVALWNGMVYPHQQPEAVKRKARDCDFYKFRGRGLNQITWRNGYAKYVNPALAKQGLKASGLMTETELKQAFQNPKVYCEVFNQYIHDMSWSGRALESIRQGIFTEYPKYVAGFYAYHYHQLYVNRCIALRNALQNQFSITTK